MTNEELAVAIKGGADDLIPVLWDQVRGFIAMRAYQTMLHIPPERGVTKEDLVQSGYFALLEAVKTFAPEKGGGFLTVLAYALKDVFAATGGYRTTRRDPLDSALSLDAPLSDDGEGETYLDTIPDRRDDYADAEGRIFTEQLHDALETALSKLPDTQAEVIRAKYWRGKNHQQIAGELGLSPQGVADREKRGLQGVRSSSFAGDLYKFIDNQTNFYRRVSTDRCRTEHTSAVEEIVLWRDKLWRSMTPPERGERK